MELDSFLLALDAAEGDPPGLHRDCKRCNRPCSVCVCYALPEQRLGSRGRVIVLQHPHEIRRRLATVPLLSAALERVDVLRGRRFGGFGGKGEARCRTPPRLLEAMEEARAKGIPVLLMFPGPGAMDVKGVAERGIPRSVAEGRGEEPGGGGGGGEGGAGEKETATAAAATAEAEAGAEAPPLAFGPVRGGEYILVAVDGTWHQGKQMFRDLAPWFLAPRGPAIRIQLPIGDAAEELSEEAAAAVARAEEERQRKRAAAEAAAADDGGGGDAPAPEAALLAGGVTRNVCADTRTIALFKEPFEGCMTTAEAIARALAELEPAQAPAAAVLSALNAVVDSQKRHDPAVRARCGIEEEQEEGGAGGEGEGEGADPKLRGNAGRGESWHKRLHERRERKRAARAARDAAAGVSPCSAREEAKKLRNQDKNRTRSLSAGLADGRNKFGFRNPPSNSCAECAPRLQPRSAEERAAREAEKLAARVENRRRKQAEAAAAAAAEAAVALAAAGEAGAAEG